MKIFFSHSSRQKPLVRAIRSNLPTHINAWIDEDDLLVGDSVEHTLEDVLSSKIDYVLLFADENAASSEWVLKEINWALEKEKALGRRIILPVVINEAAWKTPTFASLHDRKYILCPGRSMSDIRSASEKIAATLFAIICRDYERLAYGKEFVDYDSSGAPSGHENCEEFAVALREIVFPHRDYNPIEVKDVNRILEQQGRFTKIGDKEMVDLVGHVMRDGLIPGLVFDGKRIYVKEEHYRWKSEMSSEEKEAIAREAVSLISPGQIVALDSGSTTEAIARVLSVYFVNKSLRNVKIVTNAVPIINLLLDTAVSLGLDEDDDLFELHVPAGYARPNSLAIIDRDRTRLGNFADMLKAFGGADICFVGTNGIDLNHGFTTHSERASLRKKHILKYSRQRYVVGDSSKIGIHEDIGFADFASDLTLITDASEASKALLQTIGEGKKGWFGRRNCQIRLADAGQDVEQDVENASKSSEVSLEA
jgi:DeoR family fructose operon transcriptional repressor